MITIVVVDPSEIVARDIESFLKVAGFKVPAITRSEEELTALPGDLKPDVIVFGPSLPLIAGPIEKLFACSPTARGIVVRNRIEPRELMSLAAQRVLGVIHVEAGPAQYRACIGSVCENCQWIDPMFFSELFVRSQRPSADLTAREIEIVTLVQRGWRNKQIARVLGVSEGTVKMHLHHVFAKLRLATRAGLARAAVGNSVAGEPLPSLREIS